MKRDALPDPQCPAPGTLVDGTISEVNDSFGYAYIAYRDNPEFRFIFPTHLVKNPTVGREAVFKLNKALTVEEITLNPEPVRTGQPGISR
jgi:hypothetical protein